MWFMGITALGMLIMTDPSDFVDTETYDTYNYHSNFSVGPIQYIIGSLIAFSGVEACESFIASLMSKVVPSALAVVSLVEGFNPIQAYGYFLSHNSHPSTFDLGYI